MQESLLAVFSSVDHPRAPSEKGRMEFMHGVPDELRQVRVAMVGAGWRR